MLHRFKSDIAGITPPERFTWPFHYVPHPLSLLAAEQIQLEISTRKEWADEIAAGKMFGVLVVRTPSGEIGFLASFSGNIAGSNMHEGFVPPVYDMLRPNDFFRREEAEISAINRRIEALEQSAEYREKLHAIELLRAEHQHILSEDVPHLTALKQQMQQC